MTETAFLAAWSAVLGLAVGSVLTVVAWRVPRRESIVRPPSHCPACEAPLERRDRVPVASWLLLRGRCRACRARISVRYPLVEVTTAMLFAAFALRFGFDAALVGFLVLGAGCVALTVTDLDLRLLPIRIVYPTWVLGLPFLVAGALLDGEPRRLLRAGVAGAVAFALYFALNFAYPRGMAYGDVRLAGLIGTYVGYLGLAQVAVANFVAFLSSAVVGVGLIATRRAGMKTAIPFGPFMVFGAIVAILWGRGIVEAWLGPS